MHPDDNPFFKHSSRAAAHLVNVVLPPGDPGGNAKLYSQILYTILAAIYAAAAEAAEMKLEPSDN